MLEIARDMPSFAGFYYTDQGAVEVLLTNTDHLSEARGHIRPRLSRSSLDAAITARTATYSFLELARYRTVLRQSIFSIPGVVSLGVRESANRVKVGREDAEAEALVRELMVELEVPQQAVMFTAESRGIELTAGGNTVRPLRRTGTLTLDDQQPDGLLQGGWSIASTTTGCTLGFPAIRYVGQLPVFITNSHCTDVRTHLEGTTFKQPVGAQVGHEIVDPPDYTCGYPFFGDDCRHSDAAMIQADTTIDLGRIARTIDMSFVGCEHCVQSLVIDSGEPTLLISSRNDNVFENETLNKIGQTSGWTRGDVEDTCDDFESGPAGGGDSWVKQCSDRVDLNMDPGDSGSPVFSMLPDGTVELRGIIHSEQTCCLGYHDSWMSDLNQIEKDLGTLIVHDPGPPGVTIDGFTVVTPDVWCSWDAIVDKGVPPYTYEWWGMFSGSGPSIAGFVGSSGGDLIVKVTDGFGREGYDNITVIVEGDPGPFVCE